MSAPLEELRRLDKAHFWHPFTQMQEWVASEEDPIIIASGRGATLTDLEGRTYFDGNSSIWTNVHGHCHPTIMAALRDQLGRLDHCSALGFSNEPAIRLAAALVAFFPPETLTKVFYTDNGSTAIECACRMAAQYRHLVGQPERTRFIAFDLAYHGDTVGAASLGGVSLFRTGESAAGYPVIRLSDADQLAELSEETIAGCNALIIEPLIQGAAGMRTWPVGMLRRLREWCDAHDVFLILDEVMTGFGRTGKMFACEHEEVIPDFLCLAKGLTGGVLPLAATLTTDRVYEAFLGTSSEAKTFFYGHSYCGNPLACTAALASLQVFDEEQVIAGLPAKIEALRSRLAASARDTPTWGDIRQVGLIAGIDLVVDGGSDPLDMPRLSGALVCRRARTHGLLTRPVRDTLVLMPPLCAEDAQIAEAVNSLQKATVLL